MRLSCITAFGRPEWTFLRKASESLIPISRLDSFEWLLACDGVSSSMAQRMTRDFPVIPIIVPGLPARTSAGAARNRGLHAATGEYILTLDSDDFYLEPMAAMVEECLSQNHPFMAGLATDFSMDGITELPSPPSYLPEGSVPLHSFYTHWRESGLWPWHPSATICKRELMETAGGWEETGPLRDDEDTFLWATINRMSEGWLTRDSVMGYRKHPDSVTRQRDYAPGLMSFEEAWAARESSTAS